MKKLFLIAFSMLMLAAISPAVAQDVSKDTKAAMKEAKKAIKAAEKEAKKAAKEAAKAGLSTDDAMTDLENYKKAQKTLKSVNKQLKGLDLTAAQTAPAPTQAEKAIAMTVPFEVEKPTLADAGDSIAYLFGVSQSKGLKDYLTQLGVDSAQMEVFCNALIERVSYDAAEDKAKHAYFQGASVGGQIDNMTGQFSKDYYAADPEKRLSSKIVADGILAGLTGQTDINPDDAAKQWRSQMEERQKANQEKLYGENKRKGEAFLAENATKEGVVTLPSGLQYKVLTEGTGATPKTTDKVKVNYEGHLIDGTEFDSSYKRKEPSQFKCNQVIKGWTEALTHMKEGSKWEIYIPYNLAYGEKQSGKIPPFSTLIFTVELLEIVK